MKSNLPKFAKVLKKRALVQKGVYPEDSTSEYSRQVNDRRYQMDYETESTYISEEPKYKYREYQNSDDNDDDFVSDTTVRTSEALENEDFEVLRETILDLEKQNAKLRKENRQILDLKQQLEVEKEVNDNLSNKLHEAQNDLQREKQLNASLNEQLTQLEQILTGKQQITEAKSTMVLRIQEEYKTVINDYQRIQDLYNSMVVQLRESRNKVSELEAELENARQEMSQQKKFGTNNNIMSNNNNNNNFMNNFEDDFKPKAPQPFGAVDDFDFFNEPPPILPKTQNAGGIAPTPATATFNQPQNEAFFNDPLMNEPIKPPPMAQTNRAPEKEPLKPQFELVNDPTVPVRKAALVDNINFGEPDSDKDVKLGLDLRGLDRAELEDLLNELVAEKHETERLLALAPKQGISKSRAMREKEELADKADLLEKKISKIRREIKK